VEWEAGAGILNDVLLEKEIFSWDEKDLRFISAIARGAGPEFGFKEAYISKTLVKQYKHLGIFTVRSTLNKKGIKIMKFLQKK